MNFQNDQPQGTGQLRFKQPAFRPFEDQRQSRPFHWLRGRIGANLRTLRVARVLTQRMKLNADSWLDVRKAYLKLRDPEVHESLKYGFARGDEAVQFVENIRNYTDIVIRLEKPLEMDISHDLLLTDTTTFPLPKKAQTSSNVSTGK